MSVALVADNYLATGMADLSKRFKLSPTIAAVTLIAFANGAPDVLASYSSASKPGGALISIGALFGGFIFGSTLVISNVIHAVEEEIVLPKYSTLKELIFYLISVIVVCIFGLIKKSGYPFVCVYLFIYAIYIGTTIFCE